MPSAETPLPQRTLSRRYSDEWESQLLERPTPEIALISVRRSSFVAANVQRSAYSRPILFGFPARNAICAAESTPCLDRPEHGHRDRPQETRNPLIHLTYRNPRSERSIPNLSGDRRDLLRGNRALQDIQPHRLDGRIHHPNSASTFTCRTTQRPSADRA